MKIACVARFDPTSISSWSGCSCYLAKALRAQPSVTVDFIGPLTEKESFFFKTKERVYRRLLGKNYLPNVDPKYLKSFSHEAAQAIEKSNPDVILSLGALPIAYLETKKPIVYFWDCTFEGNLEYPWFANLAAESIRYGHAMEQRALDRCRIAAYSSEWATRSAASRYKVDGSKLRVIGLAANLECARTRQDIDRFVAAKSRQTCQLLFVGVDWKRKGGDVAYEVAKELNARGLETVLVVVGCEPEVAKPLPPFVKSLGFLNKLDQNDNAKIEALLAKSHFLIVPSIADSFGAVFCEASSFGTPSLARRVGGIPNAVRGGVNGQLFAKDAPISEYCDYVFGLFRDYPRYVALAQASFDEFQARLNWMKSAESLVAAARDAIEGM